MFCIDRGVLISGVSKLINFDLVLLQDKRPELVGSTVTGYEDIYRRLKTFKDRQMDISATERLVPSTAWKYVLGWGTDTPELHIYLPSFPQPASSLCTSGHCKLLRLHPPRETI